jgi:hypothetical protein
MAAAAVGVGVGAALRVRRPLCTAAVAPIAAARLVLLLLLLRTLVLVLDCPSVTHCLSSIHLSIALQGHIKNMGRDHFIWTGFSEPSSYLCSYTTCQYSQCVLIYIVEELKQQKHGVTKSNL